MKWFKPKYTVCEQCQVHFEPVEGTYNNYCQEHRQPKLDLLDRRKRVVAWAERNWERLEEQYKKEEEERLKLFQPSQGILRQAANSYGSQLQAGLYQNMGSGVLGGLDIK